MEWHQKVQYKLKNFMYEQNRRKQHKMQKVQNVQQMTGQDSDADSDMQPTTGSTKQGIKDKVNSALTEMDDYLGEQIQQHLHKKDKTN